MNLEQRLQVLLLEREQTLIELEELVQQIQQLILLAKKTEHEHYIHRSKHCFQAEKN